MGGKESKQFPISYDEASKRGEEEKYLPMKHEDMIVQRCVVQ